MSETIISARIAELERENASIKRLYSELVGRGDQCSCRFDENEKLIGMCLYHKERESRIAELEASLKELREFLPSPTEILAMTAETANLKGLLRETKPLAHEAGEWDLFNRIDTALKETAAEPKEQ